MYSETENPLPPPIETSPPQPIGTPQLKPSVWGLWPTIGFGLVIFGVYFIATLVVVISYVFFQAAATGGLDITQLAAGLTSDGLLISLSVIVSGIAGTGFIILFVKFRKGISITEYLGLHKITKKTIAVLMAVFVGIFLLSLLTDRFITAPQDAEFSTEAYLTSVWPPLLWAAVVIFAPVFEEMFFRGFLFVGLKESRLGAAGAIVLTAFLWAALHTQYSLYGMMTILVLGIIFGIVRLVTGSLWSTLFLHTAWNLAAMIGTVLTVK